MQAYVLTNWQPVSENRMFSNVLAIHINQPTKKGQDPRPWAVFSDYDAHEFSSMDMGTFFQHGDSNSMGHVDDCLLGGVFQFVSG
jgi:hypothetical protein